MTRRACKEYNPKKNPKEDSKEDAGRRRKKRFQKEVFKKMPRKKTGFSDRLFYTTFIPPLTSAPAFRCFADNAGW